ncbi:hypothetical protein [Streptomyces noursei]|uniref:hypothetical protein n=1 Tax=Streptomyces noursei TaxID=1971 RepID=UPI0038111C7C
MMEALAKRVLVHQEQFETIEVTLPWLDPEEPDVPRGRAPQSDGAVAGHHNPWWSNQPDHVEHQDVEASLG